MEAPRSRSFRRILVAVDASADSLAGLEAAAQLAAQLETELLGLFVAESDLLRAGRLPGTQEIPLFSAEPRRLDARQLERQVQAQAQRMEEALQSIAERLRLPWEFRTATGRVVEELRTLATEEDLMVVGATGRSLGRAPGSTVRGLLRESHRPLLILRRGARLGPAVHVLVDGSGAGWEALRVAAGLGRREGARLDVLLAAPDRDRAEELRRAAEERLTGIGLPTSYRRLPGTDPGRICSALRDGGGILVAPGPRFRDQRRELGQLLRSAGCPVILVGEEG
jgi:nucleotide-binding universal stress UspA family protein